MKRGQRGQRGQRERRNVIETTALRALLGLDKDSFERWLTSHGVVVVQRRRRGGRGSSSSGSSSSSSASISWDAIAHLLTRPQRAEAQRVARERIAPGGSKYWVSGYPRLVAEWHPKKNGELQPYAVSYGSNRHIWWKCPKGPDHEWRAAVCWRTLQGNGCPACAGQQLSITNCLATKYPKVAKEWHPKKNGRLTARDVIAHTDRKVWWMCKKDARHEWTASVANRTGACASKCPYCARRRTSDLNALSIHASSIAEEWHPTRNGRLRPSEVSIGSTKRVYWRCKNNRSHVWQASVNNRVNLSTGCPYCAGKKVHKTNCLATKYPRLAKEWHPRRNGSLKPTDIVAGSHRMIWWKCPAGIDHEWQAMPADRIRKGTCPFCNGSRVSVTNSLACREPLIALEWHPKKNGSLRASDVTAGSKKRVWWKCRKKADTGAGDDHEWQAIINNRTRLRNGCPYCKGKRASSSNSVAALYPAIAKEWHPTRNRDLLVTAATVTPGSSRKVWWRCSRVRAHEWQARIEKRCGRQQGCPHCRSSASIARSTNRRCE